MNKITLIFIVLLMISIITVGYFVFQDEPIQVEDTKIIEKETKDVGLEFSNYIIDEENNTVYWDDENVNIIAYPIIINKDSYVYFNLTSKVYDGDIDLTFGFDTDKIKPTKVEYYNPKTINITQHYQCDYDFNYSVSPKYYWCYTQNNVTNLTEVVREGSFEWGDIENKIAYWNDSKDIVWNNINKQFENTDYDYEGMNKWYYIKNFNINSNQTYSLRLILRINKEGFGYEDVDSKYWIAIKPSSETIQEAVGNNHLYALDPWINTSGSGFNNTGLDVNLTYYYKFDEGSGTNLIDAIEGTNNITTTIVYHVEGGVFNYQMESNASVSNAFGKVDTLSKVNNNPFAVSLWTEADSPSGYQTLLDFRQTRDFVLTLYDADLKFLDTGGSWVDTGFNFVGNTLYHIVFNYNGTGTQVYVNNVSVYSANNNIYTESGAKNCIFAQYDDSLDYDGTMDELAIWDNRSLNKSDVEFLYNEGIGMQYNATIDEYTPPPPVSEDINVTLVFPSDYFNNTQTNITFNCTSESVSPMYNLTLIINHYDNYTVTNSSEYENISIQIEYNLTDGNYNWTCRGETESNQTTASLRHFAIDTSAPYVNITYPVNTTYLEHITFNSTREITATWDYTESTPDTCRLWNGTTNISVTCADKNYTEERNYGSVNYIFFMNDSFGNLNSSEVNAEYSFWSVVTDFTQNFTEYATNQKTFYLHADYNESLVTDISAFLYLNVTEYSDLNETDDGDTLNVSRLIDLDSTGSFYPFHWVINQTVNGTEYNDTIPFASTYFANISDISLGLCNDSLTTRYINFSFLDQKSLTNISAFISSSTFSYFLGTGTSNKSLSYTNITEMNPEYNFCFYPSHLNISIDYSMNYYATNYPQKSVDPATDVFSNITTNVTLYLLSSSDGNYVTFQVMTILDQPLEDVLVSGIADIGGTETEVGTGYTDPAGAVTFWVDPDYVHNFTFQKDGYNTLSYSLYPTEDTYTITMTSLYTTNLTDYGQGVSYYIQPQYDYLINNTNYSFNITVSSTYWTLDEYGFNITNSSGVLIGETSDTTGTGGTLNLNLNTFNNSVIIMNLYWDIDGNVTTIRYTWDVFNDAYSGWSISNLFDDFGDYLDDGMFGLTTFGVNILAFLIIFTITGIMSYKYGFTSPAAISGIILALVFFFDISLGLFTLSSDYEAVSHLPTIIMTFIFISAVVREVTR